MKVETYLVALDAKLRALEGFISAVSIHREVDANLNAGFIKGSMTFVDGSVLEFSEQLPPERKKYLLWSDPKRTFYRDYDYDTGSVRRN